VAAVSSAPLRVRLEIDGRVLHLLGFEDERELEDFIADRASAGELAPEPEPLELPAEEIGAPRGRPSRDAEIDAAMAKMPPPQRGLSARSRARQINRWMAKGRPNDPTAAPGVSTVERHLAKKRLEIPPQK
jgi:hypothetical protein